MHHNRTLNRRSKAKPTLIQNRLATHTSPILFQPQLLAALGTSPAGVGLPGSRGHHETEEQNRASNQHFAHVSARVLISSNRRVERIHDERQSTSQCYAPGNFDRSPPAATDPLLDAFRHGFDVLLYSKL